jgi:hypothetical protein
MNLFKRKCENWTKKDITELCGNLYFKNKHIYTFKKIFGNDHKNI